MKCDCMQNLCVPSGYLAYVSLLFYLRQLERVSDLFSLCQSPSPHHWRGFLGGTVVKNLSANAGDTRDMAKGQTRLSDSVHMHARARAHTHTHTPHHRNSICIHKWFVYIMRRKIALSGENGQERGTRGCISVPVLPLTCVTLCKLFTLSGPQFSDLLCKIKTTLLAMTISQKESTEK